MISDSKKILYSINDEHVKEGPDHVKEGPDNVGNFFSTKHEKWFC